MNLRTLSVVEMMLFVLHDYQRRSARVPLHANWREVMTVQVVRCHVAEMQPLDRRCREWRVEAG